MEQSVREYLRVASLALLGFEGDGLAGFEQALEQQETSSTISKFINADINAVFVDASGVSASFAGQSCCIAVVRNADGPLESTKPLTQQIQVISLATGGSGSGMKPLLGALQQVTRHVYSPLLRTANASTSGPEGSNDAAGVGGSGETEGLVLLQRRLRDLDAAIDQFQRGTSVPKILLPTPSALDSAARTASVPALKGHLDKYNASQVDQFFTDLSLNSVLGSTAGEKEEFANNVNVSAKQWPAEIAKQTRLIESSFPGSAEEEISFWADLDRKLADTKEQLESAPVLLTKLVLKRTNRVSEQLIREAEMELDKAIDIAQVSVSFLRDLPAAEIAASTELHPKLSRTVNACLQHFSKLKHSRYDFNRAVRLLEVVGASIASRILTILREKGIMQCTFDELRRIKRQAEEVFSVWESQLAIQRSMLKDVAKRRNEKLRTLNFDLDSIKHRLSLVFEFREQHERLVSIFSTVLTGQEGTTVIAELNEAYQLFVRSDSDVLDTSQAGIAGWTSVRQLYERRLEKIEERVTRLVEDLLASAKTADDMFRVFATFNPLFFRPAIRSAVNAFRTVLLKNVREDVKRLQEKFRLRYDESSERRCADLRDIPPLSGRILWARQIENQLSTLMKRMEDVLGAAWEDHFEGKQLKEVCDELKSYLDTDSLYNEWLSQQLKQDLQKYNKLKDFLLVVETDPRTKKLQLKVNFDEKQVIVFNEVRYLEWLLPGMSTAHKTIPLTIRSQSKEAYVRYPIAMALQAALASFGIAKKGITDDNSTLLVSSLQAVRDLIKEALGGSKRSRRWIKWDSADLDSWVGQVSNKVFALQERVDDVNEKLKLINEGLTQLRSCPYNRNKFETIMASIQAVVDEMQIRGFSNIPQWIGELDKKIESIIADRLRAACGVWLQAFITGNSSSQMTDDNRKKEVNRDGGREGIVEIQPTIHEILLSNQILYLSPPIEMARSECISAFYSYTSIVATLPRIAGSRFQVFANAGEGPKDYSTILLSLEADCLRGPFAAIEQHVHQANIYVQQWLQYQALWDTSVLTVAERVGKDVTKWQTLLKDIKEARSTIDSVDDERHFGPIIINHRQVQNKVNLKYDTWQKDLQLRFGTILLEEARALHNDIVTCKSRLEGIYLEGATKDVIVGVEFILKTKMALSARKKAVTELEVSEKLLQRQRFQFPSDWLSVSVLVGALQDMCQVLDRRVATMDVHLPSLQAKLKEEDVSISQRTDELLQKWEKERPLEGGRSPSDVLHDLVIFSTQITKLNEDATRMRGAKEALGLDFISEDRLSFVMQEIADLKEAWQAVLPVGEKINSLKGTLLKDVVAQKMRKQLDEIVDDLRSLPAKVRSYNAVEFYLSTVNKCLAAQPVLKDLGSEALKERHWRTLTTLLGTQSHAALTVGSFWDSNPLGHRKAINEVLSTAQGELALEQFLRDLREYWTGCDLNLITRDGARLIVGWDVLFTSLDDNLNFLASLKQSPYFKNVPEFQEDSANWETRLTNLRGIFDLWVEVQRKWVYLRGIFRNPDIKAQLPAQYSKFKIIDGEYMALLKRVAVKPSVLELLQLDNLARQLERQDSTMTVIQKALGEYLERQRQIFPRFYFVNNDDLVEIIGNSNEPVKIFPHLSKMFSALTALETQSSSDDPAVLTSATAMCSKEGEIVPFTSNVNISAGVKEWLMQLESQMCTTLATLLQDCVSAIPTNDDGVLEWIDKFSAQVVILASQVAWTRDIEQALSGKDSNGCVDVQHSLEDRLKFLSSCVLKELPPSLRKKVEQLLTEMVHQRDVARLISIDKVNVKTDFKWLYHLRFYWAPKETNLMKKLCIRMSNATFFYGFEYLGIGERLVQTPLTDRCYLTLTQALHFRMGGNPFGPAGTGKTESVKMLGSQLGRFVLVFNCDSSFDYAAMGRIFAGLCQVGAWGCFDEFNRLEERILSAVSQQILTIQRGLMLQQDQIELLGNPCKLNKDVGIFVTLNPGYAGRSNLPDNLKQLFRAVAMVMPDRKIIAEVMLFSQGIVTAEALAGKVVLLFTLCEEQLSAQTHYDFGLRALKSVLTGAGELKRQAMKTADGANSDASIDMKTVEVDVLIKSTCDSVLPKLVAEDIPLFTSLLQAVFPGSELPRVNDANLLAAIKTVCEADSLDMSDEWVQKILQLKQVLDMRHGVMMVGPTCSGKTTAWRTLLKALGKVDGVKGDAYVIDPKSIRKDKLYGSLDPNTLEWTDGVFTKILRKVSDTSSSHRTGARRSWVIFDGDVDPEWAENLNSALDDNKVLTLPSGDRLKLPSNVRIMMEVDTLKYATMATVSRCGMVWFAAETLSVDVMLGQLMKKLAKEEIQMLDSNSYGASSDAHKATQAKFVDMISPYFTSKPCLVGNALEFSLSQTHIMDATVGQLLSTLYSILVRGVAHVIDYNEANTDFPMNDAHMERFAVKWVLYSLLWAFGSSMSWDRRTALADMLAQSSNSDIPANTNLLALQVNVSDGNWTEWASQVPRTEIESHRVTASDVVITTTDTVRHVEVLKAWLSSHVPLILCGPPGSGKTMTLTSVLEAMPDYILACLNFSSGTTPELILKTFAQYCEVTDSPDGLIMQPNKQSYRETQWLVIFCDEINLPDMDMYGTQRVIMFLRQLTEQKGFWNNECKWVSLRRIQFVGACNPPTDAGRKPMSCRFLRYAPLLYVDYPAEASLKQIYRCFNHALLKLQPSLRGSVDALNDAMVDFYFKNQERFTPDIAPQYIYSPRELSRWVRAMYEAMEPLEAMTLEELVRLWAHEALRLFQDRLITDDEKSWCNEQLDAVARKYFPGIDVDTCLQRPMLYSTWLKKTYQSVGKEELQTFVAARLRVFYEEELDVPLVIFDDVLEHVLRIDNVLGHPMGHLLLVGESGVGKTVLARFVSWMNGLSVFQIKATNKYTIDQFDDDLRALLRRVGIDGEKICFIFDESNALSYAFLERMNALLASGEVPGLFEGDDRTQLMSACREAYSQREGVMMDSEDELWRHFTRTVQRNLHVVFTMNPAFSDFENRCTTSPALFNRCVVDWMGTWSQEALVQVGHEFTTKLDVGFTQYSPTGGSAVLATVMDVLGSENVGLREAVVAALVSIHNTVKKVTQSKSTSRQHYLSPRDYLDLITKFVSVESEKRNFLEDQQTHIRTGLQKLLETQDQVNILRHEMVEKEAVLKAKDAEANQKLTQMVEKQNEAEQRKALAEQLTLELQKQNEEIRVRREEVEKELSEAEPALISAKQSVQNIRKQQLDEVRALARPPNAVRLTLEMVSIMIGEKNMDWNEIRKVIRNENFIPTVVNFDPLTLTTKQVSEVEEKYLNSSELDYASVDRASKACGPLYNWAVSQIKYATILRKVKPLRDEMIALQAESETLVVQQKEAVEQVAELEEAIKQYKAEYAAAIRDTETIRVEKDIVSKKVSRAEALLMSLEEEKDRWQAASLSFDKQMSTLIGDSLSAAAFLTYAGIFDHKIRKYLMREWAECLETLGVPFCPDFDVISNLSTPSEQMVWKGLGLPSDELAIQNAILLERFNRYPMIIDPSGQATQFILQKYAPQKIVQTSFLDASFLKTLASAIRFGTPLLVNDVEHIDPVLNPVLNKELQKTGGRTLIRLGSEDIDFSPKFLIILATRNPLAHFAPDLCSMTTLVNFTVTPASLEAQALSLILKAERPDVDKRRTDAAKLQGEQKVKIRELEEALLNKISAVQGAILDDDTVINTLEKIKREAADLTKEVQKTQDVMDEVRSISNTYEPLATAMAAVYFSLENLADVSFLYQYSIHFFLEILSAVLTPVGLDTATTQTPKDAAKRLESLTSKFYGEVSRRVLRGLKFEDKTLFLIRLAQIATQGKKGKELTDAEADFLLRGVAPSVLDASSTTLAKYKEVLPGRVLDDSTARQLLSLSLLPSFASLHGAMSSNPTAWTTFLDGNEPENNMPSFSSSSSSSGSDSSPERDALLKVLMIKALRPERAIYALHGYITSVFGERFNWRDHCLLDMKQVIEKDSKSLTPVMVCCEAGHDASRKIDSLAVTMNKNLLQVAMGSSEGYTEADRCIALASKSGQWVLLRNVHLCPEWLGVLEKRLHGMSTHDGFRLFLTCEISPRLPTELLRTSEVIVAEASTGVKANIQKFMNAIPASRIDRQPAERCRLYGLLAWFNAVVQERLRYAPLGWTKRYEFSEADAACSLDVVDQWLDEVAGSRAHINPEDIPWQALRTLLSQSLYGGRVDHPFDQAALDSFIEAVFCQRSYAASAPLALDHTNKALLTLPDSLSKSGFETWLASLPDANSPAWLGLPVTAESQLQILTGQRIFSKLSTLQGAIEVSVGDNGSDGDAKTKLAAMLSTVDKWLQTLPTFDSFPRTDASLISDAKATPLQRCLAREIAKGRDILSLVRQNLELIKSYCSGNMKATNEVRRLLGDFSKGLIPSQWRLLYTVPSYFNVGQWVSDFATRALELHSYTSLLTSTAQASKTVSESSTHSYWMGRMFLPEAFITATRQHTAQANKWSLEELELYLDVGSTAIESAQDTIVQGLALEGAAWDGVGSIKLSDDLRFALPASRLRWRLRSDKPTGNYVHFPLYLNETRTSLIAEVLVSTKQDVPPLVWAQRGVALVMQTSSL